MPLAALGPILAGTAGTAAATTGAWTAIGAGATAAAQLASASKTASGAKKSAQIQSDATNRGAELQAQSTREALDFQKAEAAKNQAIAEATRRANYDQWAAGQRRSGTLQQLLGLGAPEIPAYVPLEPGAGTLGAAMPQTGTNRSSPASAVPGGDYQQWFMQQIAGKPFNQQTLLDLEPTLNQAGLKLTPPNAVGDRTKIQLPDGTWVRVGFGEGHPVWIPQPGPTAPRMVPGAAQMPYGTLASALPYQQLPLTPPLPGAGYGTLGYGMRG